MFVEMSEHQAPLAKAVMVEHGLAAEIVADDDLGATVVYGIKPAAARAGGSPAG